MREHNIVVERKREIIYFIIIRKGEREIGGCGCGCVSDIVKLTLLNKEIESTITERMRFERREERERERIIIVKEREKDIMNRMW